MPPKFDQLIQRHAILIPRYAAQRGIMVTTHELYQIALDLHTNPLEKSPALS
jgi:hypothetical protein